MIHLLGAGLHKALDFVTVIIFAAAPSVLGLTGTPAYIAYALAAVHLVVTLLTGFMPGAAKPLPLAGHGLLELVVGIVLVLLPIVVGWTGTARTFYLVMGLVILVVWLLSDYRVGAGAPDVAPGPDLATSEGPPPAPPVEPRAEPGPAMPTEDEGSGGAGQTG